LKLTASREKIRTTILEIKIHKWEIEPTVWSLHIPAELAATFALKQFDRLIMVIKVNAIVLQKHHKHKLLFRNKFILD
jgi:hypothetical protein